LLIALMAVWVGRASDTTPTQRLTARLLSEHAGALDRIAIHFVPSSAALLRDTHRDFFAAIGDDVTVVFVIPTGTRQALDRHLVDVAVGDRPIRVIEVPGPITPWSKDRALVTAKDALGRAWLAAPAKPSCSWEARCHDWDTIAALAADDHRSFAWQSAPFDFDAGDFSVIGDTVVVDANLLEKNEHRGIHDVVTFRQRLAAWLGMPVVVLGRRPGDTPPHHLAMYMTPADERTVLVGDPSLAKALVGDSFTLGQPSIETGLPLRGDFGPSTQARFDRAADELRRAGFDVVRIPTVPFDDKTYVTYTNGVYEVRGRRRIAYMPSYGEAVLDDAARDTYERLGWEVRPIHVRALVPHHGTIGCLVNVLSRSVVSPTA
jgi:hypothetical protein